MNNKITFPKLTALLSQQTGATRKTCEDFLKAFFSTISDTLATGESVKVKGLGVFKVTRVEARRSVNVSTGEDFMIPEHDKISFIPAKELASAVNAPFEIFQTVELNPEVSDDEMMDEVDFAREQSQDEEVMDEATEEAYAPAMPVSESDSMPVSDKPKPEESEKSELSEESEISEEVAESESEEFEGESEDLNSFDLDREIIEGNDERKAEAVAEDPTDVHCTLAEGSTTGANSAGDNNVSTTSEMVMVDEPAISPTIVEIPKPIHIVNVEKDEHPNPRHRRAFSKGFLMGFVLSLIIVGLMMVVLYFMMVNRMQEMLDYERKAATENVISVDDSISKSNVSTELTDEEKDVVELENSKVKNDENLNNGGDVAKVADTHPSDGADDVTYDVVSTTRYLTTIAKEHYGNFQLWPYIYEENKKILGHPDRIRPGTKVVVPPLSKYGVNARSKSDIRKAVQLGNDIYARYK